MSVIAPAQLRPVDTTALIVPYGEDDTGILIQPSQKIRDAFFAIQSNGKAVFMRLGIDKNRWTLEKAMDFFDMPLTEKELYLNAPN